MPGEGKTKEQLVVDSWAKVTEIPDYEKAAGEMLFRRLFETSPEMLSLFTFSGKHSAADNEMYKSYQFTKHSTAVISAVSGAVDLLGQEDMETLVAVLKDLGARHASLHLQQTHYDYVGEALIFTLEKALGASFTTEIEDSWLALYETIADQMMLGADEQLRRQAEEEKEAEASDIIAKSFVLFEVAAKTDPNIAEQNRQIAAQKQVFEAKATKRNTLEEYDDELTRKASNLICQSFSKIEETVNLDPMIAERNRQIAEQKELFEKQRSSEEGKSENEIVVESWDKIKAIPNYPNIAGELLFRRVFELSPEVATLFQFAEGYITNDDAMFKSNLFLKHSTAVISSVTAAVNLLEAGDMDSLVSMLKDLGARHARFDLGEEHYNLLRESLLFTLEKMLGIAFSSRVKESWVTVYTTISENMLLGSRQYAYSKASEEKKEEAERNEPSIELVSSSWAKVKEVPEYEKNLGQLMFRRIFDLQPDATAFFPFAEGYSFDDEEMYESIMFEKHIVGVVLSIDAAVGLLENGDMKGLDGALRDLGARHVAFGLNKSDYDLVGEALLFSLREIVGSGFDTRTKNSWAGVYAFIADTMMQGTTESVERIAESVNNVDAADLVSKSFLLTEAAAIADPTVAKENRKIAEQKKAYDARVANLIDEKSRKAETKPTKAHSSAAQDAAAFGSEDFSLAAVAATKSSMALPSLTRSGFSRLKVLVLLLLTAIGAFIIGLSYRAPIPARNNQSDVLSTGRPIIDEIEELQNEVKALEKDFKTRAKTLKSKLSQLKKAKK
eukprot:scaffold1469_cov119-Cylindrotheca_fusiformis.AAC.8